MKLDVVLGNGRSALPLDKPPECLLIDSRPTSDFSLAEPLGVHAPDTKRPLYGKKLRVGSCLGRSHTATLIVESIELNWSDMP